MKYLYMASDPFGLLESEPKEASKEKSQSEPEKKKEEPEKKAVGFTCDKCKGVKYEIKQDEEVICLGCGKLCHYSSSEIQYISPQRLRMAGLGYSKKQSALDSNIVYDNTSRREQLVNKLKRCNAVYAEKYKRSMSEKIFGDAADIFIDAISQDEKKQKTFRSNRQKYILALALTEAAGKYKIYVDTKMLKDFLGITSSCSISKGTSIVNKIKKKMITPYDFENIENMINTAASVIQCQNEKLLENIKLASKDVYDLAQEKHIGTGSEDRSQAFAIVYWVYTKLAGDLSINGYLTELHIRKTTIMSFINKIRNNEALFEPICQKYK